jgi:hypothetical protein
MVSACLTEANQETHTSAPAVRANSDQQARGADVLPVAVAEYEQQCLLHVLVQCATSRKVAGSLSYEVTECFT